MEKFIPYQKLSKKEKRKLNQSRRATWGNVNPVTRKPENSRAYNRKKALRSQRECWSECFCYSVRTLAGFLPGIRR